MNKMSFYVSLAIFVMQYTSKTKSHSDSVILPEYLSKTEAQQKLCLNNQLDGLKVSLFLKEFIFKIEPKYKVPKQNCGF